MRNETGYLAAILKWFYIFCWNMVVINVYGGDIIKKITVGK